MQHEHHALEPYGVDGSICTSIPILDNLQDTSGAKAFEGLGLLMLPAILGKVKSISKEAVGPLVSLPEGEGFWGNDPYGNIYQITSDTSWFQNTGKPVGGVAGVVIGVSDIDKSIKTGKFRNKSHFVEFAVKKLLEDENKESDEKIIVELE